MGYKMFLRDQNIWKKWWNRIIKQRKKSTCKASTRKPWPAQQRICEWAVPFRVIYMGQNGHVFNLFASLSYKWTVPGKTWRQTRQLPAPICWDMNSLQLGSKYFLEGGPRRHISASIATVFPKSMSSPCSGWKQEGTSQTLTDGLDTWLFVDNGDPTCKSSVFLLPQGDCMFHMAEPKGRGATLHLHWRPTTWTWFRRVQPSDVIQWGTVIGS